MLTMPYYIIEIHEVFYWCTKVGSTVFIKAQIEIVEQF